MVLIILYFHLHRPIFIAIYHMFNALKFVVRFSKWKRDKETYTREENQAFLKSIHSYLKLFETALLG